MSLTRDEERLELQKLATAQINALGYSGKITLETDLEEKYLAFYEKIFNKLKELSAAD